MQQSASVSPEPRFVDPHVRVQTTVSYPRGERFPVEALAELRLDGRVLGRARVEPGQPKEIRIPGTGKDYSGLETQFDFAFSVALSPRALEAIAASRDTREDGDVALEVGVWVRTLEVRTYVEPELGAQVEQGYLPVLRVYDERLQTGRLRLLGLMGDDDVVRLRWLERKLPVTIPSSDWTQRFAPAFGLGRSMVFDLPLPATTPPSAGPSGESNLVEALRLASDRLLEMERSMEAGEWGSVVHDSRHVAELMRAQRDDVERLLIEDGATEDGAEALVASMQGLFDFASKGVHSTDRSNKPRASHRARKEEAQFALAAAAATVNLIVAKLDRGAEGRP